MSYQDFLLRKLARAESAGFTDVDRSDISPHLKPHNRDAAVWALRGGRRALFLSFGLGKTRTQLEIMRHIHQRTGGRTLIVLPLGVRQEFKADAQVLGMEVEYVRTNEEVLSARTPYLLTNYERVRDGQISPDLFTGATLDEASCLRSYGSLTYQTFLRIFRSVPYRFVATATPSPNRYKELIHYAAFLGVMDSGQALTRFFQRNSEKAGDLTLMPHREAEFWHWVSTWGLFITKPSDLGYSDEGYDLPPLNVHYHEIEVAHKGGVGKDGQMALYADNAIGVTAAAAVKQETLERRIREVCQIVDAGGPERHWLLWHHLEPERLAIEREMKEAVTIWGGLDLDERERRVIAFSNGEIRLFGTKPSLSGSGCNFQRHCSDAVFAGVNFDFNDFIQSIHRLYRFGQKRPVDVHLVYADSERTVLRTLERKWAQDRELREQMTAIVRSHGLSLAA